MIISPVTVAHEPQLINYTSAGSYTYTIPQWATHIDVITIGGGGGGNQGNGGNGATGSGGGAGSWRFRTLERGTDIPWATTVFSAIVGGGGSAGGKGGPNPGAGGQSYVSDGSITILSDGGIPGSGTNGNVGGSPGDVTVGGRLYVGGATAPSGGARTNGNAPGGGGGGGAGGIFNTQTAGMAGAPGAVYFYAYMKIPPPRIQITDPLDSSSAFSVFNSGSGIAFSGGEALWNGTTDGQGIAIYNTPQATTNNQYASATVGSYIAGAATGLILHSDVGYTGYYAGAFYNTRVTLMRTSGRWNQNAYTTITDAAATVNVGSLVEFWNIGETFYMAVDGTTYITYSIGNPIIDEYHRYQGFGMFRATFISSARISTWNAGDASAWGKV